MGDISKDIQSSFVSNKQKAFINLKYTASYLNAIENDFFKSFHLSPQQYNILRILRGAKQAIRAQDVKERMIERAPNATRLMDKLYDKKLIDRFRCEHDKRVIYVDITKSGLQLLDTIDKTPQENLLKNITEKEAKKLSDLLDKIR